jgi:hypothetical protein
MKSPGRRRRAAPPKPTVDASAPALASADSVPADSFARGDEVARGIAALFANDRRSISSQVLSHQPAPSREQRSHEYGARVDDDHDDTSPDLTRAIMSDTSADGPAPSVEPGPHVPAHNPSRHEVWTHDNWTRDTYRTQDTWSLHSELFRCIAALEKTMMAERSNLRLGLRNSNAREPIARIPFDSKDHRAIDHAVAVLKALPPQPATPPADALAAAAKLQSIGERICTHFAIHVDEVAPKETHAGAPAHAALLALLPCWGILAFNLIAVAGAARDWIDSTGVGLS